RLCRLLTRGRRNAPKGECRLTLDDLADHAGGLLACVVMKHCWSSGFPSAQERRLTPNADPYHSPSPLCGGEAGWGGESRRAGMAPHPNPPPSRGRELACDAPLSIGPPVPLNVRRLKPELQLQPDVLHTYREIFSDRCYALAELHHGPNDRLLLAQMHEVARAHHLPLVAANDVHYHEPDRRFLADVLDATRAGCTVAELGHRQFPNAERHLKSPAQMAKLFSAAPHLIFRTTEVADRCTFSLDELRYEYPEELSSAGMTPLEYLTQLTWQGARDRYPQGLPEKVRGLIEYELQLIAELHYEAYFLTVR